MKEQTSCMMPLSMVTKIKETTDIEMVNRLIKENWILLHVVKSSNQDVKFSLGRID